MDSHGWLFSEAGTFLPINYSTAKPQKYELLDGSGKIHLNKWPKVFTNYSKCFSDGVLREKNTLGHWEVGWLPGTKGSASNPVELDVGEETQESLVILDTPLPSQPQRICVMEQVKAKATAKKALAKKTKTSKPGKVQVSKAAGTKGPPRKAKTKGKKVSLALSLFSLSHVAVRPPVYL